MANPNLTNLTSMYGKTAVAQLTTGTTTLISNAGASGELVKINSLIVSNVDGLASAEVNAWILRSSVAYNIASTITVPNDATLVLISKDTSIYLEEGDSLQLSAGTTGDLEVVCSYELIS